MERTALNLTEAFQIALRDVWESPEYHCSPRRQNTKEILGYRLIITDPSQTGPVITADAERNEKIAAYTRQEIVLHGRMANTAEEMGKVAKHWKEIANPDGTVNSAYGYIIWAIQSCRNRLFSSESYTPWQWAMKTLKADKDSRQAIILLNDRSNFWDGNKDLPCTTDIHFLIRENQLHMFVDMRSNDIVWGLAYDLAFFAHVMQKAHRELRNAYPDLKLGQYTHYSHSMHIYERHYNLAQRMLFPAKA